MNSQLRILLADDDHDDYNFFVSVVRALNLPHYIIRAAKDTELFFALEKEPDLDLIIIDINMPGRNGKECLKEIKSHEKYRHIPVIILTSSKNESDVMESYHSGAHYYAIKPYSYHNYVATMEKIFNLDWKSRQPIPQRDSFVINNAFI
jgi:DNA-binding response OmpR family regulator